MQGYRKISEVSKEWGISERRVNALCLEGAEKFGNVWVIPEESEKPADERLKSGRYIKEKD